MNTPVAVRWLNYHGDVSDGLSVGQPKGPNTFGEVLYVVDWAYDLDFEWQHFDDDGIRCDGTKCGRTRVGLTYIVPVPVTP